MAKGKSRCGRDIEKCPTYKAMKLIGRKWTLHVLQEFYLSGPRLRYNEIQRALPWITPKVLSQRLRELESEGMLKRRVLKDKVPAGVEYCLTNKGEDLEKVIEAARAWGIEWDKSGQEHVVCKKKRST